MELALQSLRLPLSLVRGGLAVAFQPLTSGLATAALIDLDSGSPAPWTPILSNPPRSTALWHAEGTAYHAVVKQPLTEALDAEWGTSAATRYVLGRTEVLTTYGASTVNVAVNENPVQC